MTAAELVRHMTQVLAFALAVLTRTERTRHEPLEWDGEVERFYTVLGAVDAAFAAGAPIDREGERRLVQGPLADVLTHIGQLHALRRLIGAPVPPESYLNADIRIGRLALHDQPEPRSAPRR